VGYVHLRNTSGFGGSDTFDAKSSIIFSINVYMVPEVTS